MEKSLVFILVSFCLVACHNSKPASYCSALDTASIITVTDAAMQWQMDNYARMQQTRWDGDNSWANGIYLTAAYEWGLSRQNNEMTTWVRERAAKMQYEQGNSAYTSVYSADNMPVSMLYADIYNKEQDVRVLHPTVARLQFIVSNPSPTTTLVIDTTDHNFTNKQRWAWCDALFMAPQVLARYAILWNDPTLLEFMDQEYHFTTDYLLDTTYNFYYRDSNYFGKKEANGKPVFWGRGQGWVIAGLARMIPYLPEEWSGRQYYIDLYKKMIDALVSVQSEAGNWYVTMLDPESYPTPEMSSTGFITYALWWGINAGILDEAAYLESATKGWQALVRAVQPNGMLGYVQAVGEKPEHITADMTEVYGPAAMAFAAMEIVKYINNHNSNSAS